MRIAILADIHGNLPALEAALAEVVRLRVDRVVVAGDIVVGSPDSGPCWERIEALQCPVLRGNHERYVFDLHTERAPPAWKTRQFGPVQFAAAQFTADQLRRMAELPAYLEFGDCPDLLFVHGSSRSDNDLIFPYTADEEIVPMFPSSAPRWIIRGHNHFASVRLWGERRIVTVGSVGLPLDGTPSAQFTVMERNGGDWTVSHRSVAYDIDATVRRYWHTGYIEAAGPMARLYLREVQTASFQIVPFIKAFREAQTRKPELQLEAAVYAFLAGELV